MPPPNEVMLFDKVILMRFTFFSKQNAPIDMTFGGTTNSVKLHCEKALLERLMTLSDNVIFDKEAQPRKR